MDWLWKEWANVLRIRNEGVPVVGFTWYSLTDQVDWDAALRAPLGNVNPVGLFDHNRDPRTVGLAYQHLVRLFGGDLSEDPDGTIAQPKSVRSSLFTGTGVDLCLGQTSFNEDTTTWASAIFAASDEVTHAEFHRFVERLDLREALWPAGSREEEASGTDLKALLRGSGGAGPLDRTADPAKQLLTLVLELALELAFELVLALELVLLLALELVLVLELVLELAGTAAEEATEAAGDGAEQLLVLALLLELQLLLALQLLFALFLELKLLLAFEFSLELHLQLAVTRAHGAPPSGVPMRPFYEPRGVPFQSHVSGAFRRAWDDRSSPRHATGCQRCVSVPSPYVNGAVTPALACRGSGRGWHVERRIHGAGSWRHHTRGARRSGGGAAPGLGAGQQPTRAGRHRRPGGHDGGPDPLPDYAGGASRVGGPG